MVRISKQQKRRRICPRKRRYKAKESRPCSSSSTTTLRIQENALEGEPAKTMFIAKVK